MARDLPTESDPEVSKRERTWRVQLETPANVDSSAWWGVFHREIATTYQSNRIVTERSNNNPRRTLGAIAAQEFTAGGITVTGMQLMQLIALAGDTFAQEDEV